MQGKYKVITLCGSTRFKDEFLRIQKKLTLEGHIVISVGLFGHSGDKEVWDIDNKEMLDDMHRSKIDMADEIFVINVGGYIGESTKSEIAYAESKGKTITYLEQPSFPGLRIVKDTYGYRCEQVNRIVNIIQKHIDVSDDNFKKCDICSLRYACNDYDEFECKKNNYRRFERDEKKVDLYKEDDLSRKIAETLWNEGCRIDALNYKVVLDTLEKNYGDRILFNEDGSGGSLKSLIELLKKKCQEK